MLRGVALALVAACLASSSVGAAPATKNALLFQSASGPTSCPQATAFLSRTTGLTAVQRAWYTKKICFLVAGGTWQKLDGLYILAAPTKQAYTLNLIQNKYNLTSNGTASFGPNAGYLSDNTTGYLDTGFVPSAATGAHFTLTSASMGVGITDTRQAINGGFQMGAGDSTFTYFDVLAIGNSFYSPNGNSVLLNNGTYTNDTTVTNYSGTWIANRNGTTLDLDHNGTLLQTSTSTAAGMVDNSLLIGAVDVGGPSPCDDSISWAFFGGSLTSTDISNLQQAMADVPLFAGGVPAAAWGFTTNRFNYNFANAGLTGIDVNATNAPGFAFYNTFFFGCATACGEASAPAGSYTFSGGLVTAGANAQLTRLATRGDTSSAFTGTSSGTTLTVTSVLYGPILVGQVVAGNAAFSGQTIVQQLSGTTGGAGTYQLSSAVTLATSSNLQGSSSVGTPGFAPGGYYEAVLSNNPANDNAGSNSFPSFWLEDIGGLLSQNLNTGYGAADHFSEIDVWEGVSGSRAADTNFFDWTTTNGGGFGSNNNVHQTPFPTPANPTGLHSYGLLWVPSALNAGSGFVQFFFDREPIGSPVTYTAVGTPSPACAPSNPAGCLFISESGSYVLLFDGGGDGASHPYPINLSNVNVWH